MSELFQCNICTSVCLPVRGDNSRVVMSGLSPGQADKMFYTALISVDLPQCEIFCSKAADS